MRDVIAPFYGVIVRLFIQTSLVLRSVTALAKWFSSLEATRVPSPTGFQTTAKTIFAEYKTAYSTRAGAA